MMVFRMLYHFMTRDLWYPRRMQFGWCSVSTQWDISSRTLSISKYSSLRFLQCFWTYSIIWSYILKSISTGKIGLMHFIWEKYVRSLAVHTKHLCHIMLRLLPWIHQLWIHSTGCMLLAWSYSAHVGNKIEKLWRFFLAVIFEFSPILFSTPQKATFYLTERTKMCNIEGAEYKLSLVH